MSEAVPIQVEAPPLEAYDFGCFNHGLIWTNHLIYAKNSKEADQIHDARYPEHQFITVFHRVAKPKIIRKPYKKREPKIAALAESGVS